jgi:pterin-4a-carbinolamine dehydratase
VDPITEWELHLTIRVRLLTHDAKGATAQDDELAGGMERIAANFASA